VENVKIKKTAFAGPAVQVINSSDMLITGVILQGDNPALTSVIDYEVNDGGNYQGLIINNVIAPENMKGGIVLKSADTKGSLTNIRISNSFVEVENKADFDGVTVD
jgi:hypothetical protein